MTGSHLSNDDFFLRLSELFEERRKKDHGSIFLTQKRMTYETPASTFPDQTSSDPFPDLHPTTPLPILIRATDGKSKKERQDKIKLSTVVEADALESFFGRYAEVCKTGMAGLKKRDRSKLKAKLKAKKKKGGEEVKKA